MGLIVGEPIEMMTSTGLAPVVVPGEEIPVVTSIGPETKKFSKLFWLRPSIVIEYLTYSSWSARLGSPGVSSEGVVKLKSDKAESFSRKGMLASVKRSNIGAAGNAEDPEERRQKVNSAIWEMYIMIGDNFDDRDRIKKAMPENGTADGRCI
jgi:hypothetical protein